MTKKEFADGPGQRLVEQRDAAITARQAEAGHELERHARAVAGRQTILDSAANRDLEALARHDQRRRLLVERADASANAADRARRDAMHGEAAIRRTLATDLDVINNQHGVGMVDAWVQQQEVTP